MVNEMNVIKRSINAPFLIDTCTLPEGDYAQVCNIETWKPAMRYVLIIISTFFEHSPDVGESPWPFSHRMSLIPQQLKHVFPRYI